MIHCSRICVKAGLTVEDVLGKNLYFTFLLLLLWQFILKGMKGKVSYPVCIQTKRPPNASTHCYIRPMYNASWPSWQPVDSTNYAFLPEVRSQGQGCGSAANGLSPSWSAWGSCRDVHKKKLKIVSLDLKFLKSQWLTNNLKDGEEINHQQKMLQWFTFKGKLYVYIMGNNRKSTGLCRGNQSYPKLRTDNYRKICEGCEIPKTRNNAKCCYWVLLINIHTYTPVMK